MPKIEISIMDIIQYVDGRSRPVREGEALFKAGHIILCGVKASDPKTIMSLCLQTSALSSPPHEIEINLTDDVRSWKCVCSCKAGQSGFCKHVVGTLVYINRHEDLDLLSSTDLTQAWGKEKKGIAAVYEETKIEQFWCHKPKREDIKSHEDIDQRNFNRLVLCNPSSAIFKFLERKDEVENFSGNMSRVTACPAVMKHLLMILENSNTSIFLDSININVAEFNLQKCCQKIITDLGSTDQLKIANEYKQQSDLWKEERMLRITGSRCYSIFTYGKEEWEKKSMDYFFPTPFQSVYTTHGTTYESEALNCYKFHNQHCEVVTPGLIVCKRFPWLAYSPDGVVVVENKLTALLEIKCPYSGNTAPASDFANTCDYLVTVNNQLTVKKKHKIYGQIQFGMALLNLSQTHLLFYSVYSKSYIQIVVNFDEEFAKLLIERVSTRYLRNMLHVYCSKNKEKSKQ